MALPCPACLPQSTWGAGALLLLPGDHGPAVWLVSPSWTGQASAVPSLCGPFWSEFAVNEYMVVQDHLALRPREARREH